MKLSFDYKKLLRNKQLLLRTAIISLLIMAALFLLFFRTGNNNDEVLLAQSDAVENQSAQEELTEEVIIVDVSGEVKSPSVVELPANSRIEDAIAAAGGLTKNADISQINRAAMISDGDKVLIPTKAESGNSKSESSNSKASPNSKSDGNSSFVNINQANSTKLQEIPGIGPVTAEKIIKYREDNGLFLKLEDLKKVSGIGDKTYEKMKPYISI